MAKRLIGRKTLRKSSRRKTMRRKTMRRKTLRRKTMRRKTLRRKTMKGGIIGMQCGKQWIKKKDSAGRGEHALYTRILNAKNDGWGTGTYYTIQMTIKIKNVNTNGKIKVAFEIPRMKLKDIKNLRNRIKENESLNDILDIERAPNFREFLRGDGNNCTDRFNDIEDFFNHIISRIEIYKNTASSYVMKIIEILQSMGKLPSDFIPSFFDSRNRPVSQFMIKDSRGNDVVMQGDDGWAG